MRILFLTPFPPSNERPDALHHPQLLSRKHDVTCVLLYRNEAELSFVPALKKTVHRVCTVRLSRTASLVSCARRALTTWPLYLAFYYDRAVSLAIRAIAGEERPDLVHAHTLRMAPYAADVDAPFRVCNIQDVLTTRYEVFARMRPSLRWPLDVEEWHKLSRFEPKLWASMNRIGVVSEEEAVAARRTMPGLEPSVIRPGIDPDYFEPLPQETRQPTVVFLGRFSYRPNVAAAMRAARDVFPLVRRRVPAARLVLVGSDPPAGLRALAGRDGVEVTGRVEDVRPYLGRATLSLSPMTIGGGVKYKVLQSLAMATPVVTTSLGAEGTGLVPGRDILVAERDADLAESCVELLLDPTRCQALGEAGREVVVRRHGWNAIGESLEAFHRA